MEVIQITEEAADMLRKLKQRVKDEHGKFYAYSDFIVLGLKQVEEMYEQDHEKVLIELEMIKAQRLAKNRFLRQLKKKKGLE